MKYNLCATITVSCYCEVEADSEAEAIEKSRELMPALKFNGSGTWADENWLIEEADGEPQDIRVEEVSP